MSLLRRVLAWLGLITDFSRPIVLKSNSTLDGKGKWARRGIRVIGHNVVVRNVRITNPYGDGISIDPLRSDMVLVEHCEIASCYDGLIDCASSELSGTSPLCRIVIRSNLLRDHDKGILLGRTSEGGEGDFRVRAIIEQNHFQRVGQRTPSLEQLAYAEVSSNVIELEPFLRADGSFGGCSGIVARFGGKAVARGNLFSGPRPDRFVMGNVEIVEGTIDVDSVIARCGPVGG